MNRIFTLLLVMIGIAAFQSCKKEATPDPTGTNTITINYTSTYSEFPLSFYKGPDEDNNTMYPYVWIKGGIWDASLNMVFISLQSGDATYANTFNTLYNGGEMVNLGSVGGLGDIVTKPTSGWTTTSSTEVGHGYVMRIKHTSNYTGSSLPYDYYRLYVVEWMKDMYGNILGAKVKYQGPF